MNEAVRFVKTLPVDEFFWIVTVTVLVSAYGLFSFFRYFWRYRVMENTPTAKVRSAAQGFNEFVGKAELLPGEPIIAPLTQLPCVWFAYTVEEKQSHHVRGRTKTTWRVRETGISDGIFALRCETGQAVVNPDDATVIPSASDVWYGNTASPQAGPRGAGSSSLFMTKRYRYREQRLHEGDDLYVLGQFLTQQPLLVSLDTQLSAILKAWKSDPQALKNRFDHNRNDEIEEGEWQDAVQFAKKEAQAVIKEQASQSFHLIEKPTESRQPFIISSKGEGDLTSTFKLKSTLGLLAFLALGTMAVWMLTVR